MSPYGSRLIQKYKHRRQYPNAPHFNRHTARAVPAGYPANLQTIWVDACLYIGWGKKKTYEFARCLNKYGLAVIRVPHKITDYQIVSYAMNLPRCIVLTEDYGLAQMLDCRAIRVYKDEPIKDVIHTVLSYFNM